MLEDETTTDTDRWLVCPHCRRGFWIQPEPTTVTSPFQRFARILRLWWLAPVLAAWLIRWVPNRAVLHDQRPYGGSAGESVTGEG